MIPEDCRECWDPECIRKRMSGEAIEWNDFGKAGSPCPFFVPTVNALHPCSCCGQDMAMVDMLESGGLFVWCQNCGTTTNTFETVEEAVRAWNIGEVSSQ